jgi:hypothetical protein
MNQADLDTLVISAVRYALGRMTYIVGEVARIAATAEISPQARDVILRDLSEAIARDNYAREQGKDALNGGLPLGMNCDRREWELLYDDLRTRGVG